MADKQQECAGPSKKTLMLPYPCKKCRGETWLKRLQGKAHARSYLERVRDEEAQEMVGSGTHGGTVDTKKSSGESTLIPAKEDVVKDIPIPSIKIDNSFCRADESHIQPVNGFLRTSNTKYIDDSEYAEWLKRRNRFSWTPSVDISEYVTRKKAGLLDDTESFEQDAEDEYDHPFFVSGALPYVETTALTGNEDEKETHPGLNEERGQLVVAPLDDNDNVYGHDQAASSTQFKELFTSIKGAKKGRGRGAALKALFRRLFSRAGKEKNNSSAGYIRLRSEDKENNKPRGSTTSGAEDQGSNATSQDTAVNKFSCEGSDKDQEFAKNKCWPEPIKPVYTVDKDDASL
ncbi:hypothetical protein F5884DRAFT_747769 [Xylogone sp. PMI_703]|nr:hypothetical protein F5884DRAFT_747769 [Xylogone sp. PMI_703]